MLLLANKAVVYGSKAGNWDYGYGGDLKSELLVTALSWTAGITVAYWLSDKFIERARWIAGLIVVAWIALGLVFHVYTRGLYHTSLSKILKHDACTSFYTAAKRTTPKDLLSNFEKVAPTLPLHAKTNMPGKTLMFEAALAIDKNATKAARILIGFAALAGFFVFAAAERLFRSRRVALLALVLFLVLPQKLNFFPQPNTVTPLFVFLSFWLLLVYLDRLQVWILLLLGLALYVLFIYEPLPFVIGLLFVGAIGHRVAEGRLRWRELWKLAVFPLLGFGAGYLAMKLSYGFDAFAAFKYMYEDAVQFNVRDNRPYDVWVVANLVEFSIGIGLVSAMMLALGWFQTAGEAWQWSRTEGVRAAARRLFAAPATNLLICLFATILILDAWGLNRGETTRLWIFLGVAVELTLAGYCFDRFGPATARLMVATCTLQAIISSVIVSFMNC